MIRLFKNKKLDDKKTSGSVFQKVNQWYTRYELKFADGINRRTKNWTTRQWKYFLTIFCLVGGTAASYQMVSSITGAREASTTQLLTIVSPQFPQYAAHPGVMEPANMGLISDTEYSRLVMFENYLDSIKASPGGQLYYDSLMSTRSGLMDTIQTIKRLYLLQRSR
jgi:hypothetical protein